MLYSVIEINKKSLNEHGYIVKCYDLPYDREDWLESLNPGIASYIYESSIEKEVAFKKLKEAMIKKYNEDILKLYTIIDNLETLELNYLDI